MHNVLRFLFSLDGRISRTHYLITGAILLAFKFLIDHAIAAHFGQPWHLWNYFAPPRDLTVFGLGTSNPTLYLILICLDVLL